MRRSLSILILLLAGLRAEAVIDVSLQMQLGNPSGAQADTNNHDHYLIQRPVEAIDYRDNLGQPNWASWDLTAADVGDINRNSSFYTDTNLPPNFYRVTPDDYDGVGNIGFARGHLCPSEDRTDTTNDNKMVFYMSNIMPQDAINNSGVWGTFEGYCRSLTQSNELLIVCGPGGFDGTRLNTNGPVFIPTFVWKIAVVVPLGSGTATNRITTATRVIALKIPNTDAATNLWPEYVTTARQIEADTGLTFFTGLPTNVATALRNKVDGQFASTLVGWDVSGVTGSGVSPFASTTNSPGLTIGGLTRGSGITASSLSGGWGGANFSSTTAAAAIAADKVFTFSVMAKTNYQVNYTAVSQFSYRRSMTGPTNGVLQYEIDGGPFTDIADLSYSTSSSSGGAVGPIDLSGIAALQGVGAGTNVTFRIVNYDGGTSGTWYLFKDSTQPTAATDLELQGEVWPSSLPILALQWINSNLILSWPVLYGSYTLQQSGDLGAADWFNANLTTSTNSGIISVTVPSTQGAAFFRLFHP
ncbi:MAG TPA: DNA/RNA non-specific endonuclease [Verrucomicrobiae bacterium]|jgi:DNA/RNA endonuclease G (NUC1)